MPTQTHTFAFAESWTKDFLSLRTKGSNIPGRIIMRVCLDRECPVNKAPYLSFQVRDNQATLTKGDPDTVYVGRFKLTDPYWIGVVMGKLGVTTLHVGELSYQGKADDNQVTITHDTTEMDGDVESSTPQDDTPATFSIQPMIVGEQRAYSSADFVHYVSGVHVAMHDDGHMVFRLDAPIKLFLSVNLKPTEKYVRLSLTTQKATVWTVEPNDSYVSEKLKHHTTLQFEPIIALILAKKIDDLSNVYRVGLTGIEFNGSVYLFKLGSICSVRKVAGVPYLSPVPEEPRKTIMSDKETSPRKAMMSNGYATAELKGVGTSMSRQITGRESVTEPQEEISGILQRCVQTLKILLEKSYRLRKPTPDGHPGGYGIANPPNMSPIVTLESPMLTRCLTELSVMYGYEYALINADILVEQVEDNQYRVLYEIPYANGAVVAVNFEHRGMALPFRME